MFPIQRSAQHAAGQQSSRMLYKSAISMSSKGSAGWTQVHLSHCSHVVLASREQNVISITFFPVICRSHRACISIAVPCCEPQTLPEVVLGAGSGCARPWKEAGQGGCSFRGCKQRHWLTPVEWHRQCHGDNLDPAQSAVTRRTRVHSVHKAGTQKHSFSQGSPHPPASKALPPVGLAHRFQGSSPKTDNVSSNGSTSLQGGVMAEQLSLNKDYMALDSFFKVRERLGFPPESSWVLGALHNHHTLHTHSSW